MLKDRFFFMNLWYALPQELRINFVKLWDLFKGLHLSKDFFLFKWIKDDFNLLNSDKTKDTKNIGMDFKNKKR